MLGECLKRPGAQKQHKTVPYHIETYELSMNKSYLWEGLPVGAGVGLSL